MKRRRKYLVNKVDEKLTPKVREIVTRLFHDYLKNNPMPEKCTHEKVSRRRIVPVNKLPLTPDSLVIYAVDQDRGRAYFNKDGKRVITIPVWATKRGELHLEWYCAHELAHHFNQYSGTNDNHGPEFMRWLKKLCPERSIHFELGYKPRNAASAGIKEN